MRVACQILLYTIDAVCLRQLQSVGSMHRIDWDPTSGPPGADPIYRARIRHRVACSHEGQSSLVCEILMTETTRATMDCQAQRRLACVFTMIR